MATSLDSTRLALRPCSANFQGPQGAWWPQNRTLGDQLRYFFDLWPSGEERISRVLYSPPDWDDRPHSVQVSGRRIKTGSFPRDDTRELTLVMHDGKRRSITVIPPATSRRKAGKLLDAVTDGGSDYRRSNEGSSQQARWEDEGGHA
jgi:hypothetical protein